VSDLSTRVRRLLFLVPYVARQRDGVRLDELAGELEIDRSELLADVDLLSQVGPPSGDPSEYLLVTVDAGKVFVDLPQGLTRPMRLTPAEGCSLLLGLRALRRSGIAPYDEALASAEKKLLVALGADARAAEQLAEGTVVAGPDETVARHVRALVIAARARRTVTIEYTSASSGRASRRGLEPYGVIQHAGEWYVVGRCQLQGDTRTFRVDRIVSLEASERSFAPPADFDLAEYRRDRLFVPGADAITVSVRLDPIGVARVGASWPAGRVERLPDGSAILEMECDGLEWVLGWALGLGAHAEVIAPTAARDALRARVDTMLGEYDSIKPR
jgi:proteasome accessory factor C